MVIINKRETGVQRQHDGDYKTGHLQQASDRKSTSGSEVYEASVTGQLSSASSVTGVARISRRRVVTWTTHALPLASEAEARHAGDPSKARHLQPAKICPVGIPVLSQAPECSNHLSRGRGRMIDDLLDLRI